MTLFEDASEFLMASLDSVAGREIKYTRPGVGSVYIRAIRGVTNFQTQDNGVQELMYIKSDDYIFPTSDLVLGGQNVTPRRGDKIEDAGITKTVLTDGSDAMYKYTDQSRLTLRVHTKEVG